MTPDNKHVPSALPNKASAVRAESKMRWSPRAGALRWNWVVFILLLPLAGYGAYALTRDFLPKRTPVETSLDRPAAASIVPPREPASIVPQPEPPRAVKPRPAEIQPVLCRRRVRLRWIRSCPRAPSS